MEDKEIWFNQIHFAEIISLLELKAEVKDFKKHPKDQIEPPISKHVSVDRGRSITIESPAKAEDQHKKDTVIEHKKSGLSVYKEYIGKRIKRRTGKFGNTYDLEGIITEVDDEYVVVNVDKGKGAGKETKILLSFIISNKGIYEIT